MSLTNKNRSFVGDSKDDSKKCCHPNNGFPSLGRLRPLLFPTLELPLWYLSPKPPKGDVITRPSACPGCGLSSGCRCLTLRSKHRQPADDLHRVTLMALILRKPANPLHHEFVRTDHFALRSCDRPAFTHHAAGRTSSGSPPVGGVPSGGWIAGSVPQ